MATYKGHTYMTHFNEAFAVTPFSATANTEYAYQGKDKHWKYVIVGTSTADGQMTFFAGDSVLAGGDVVVPFSTGTFAISVEDALVKINAPHTVDSQHANILDVIKFKSSVDLTNVMIIKLP